MAICIYGVNCDNPPPGLPFTTGIPLKGCLFILILAHVFLFSCASTREFTPTKNSQLIEDVPFFPQQEYHCGPASLAGVLNYWSVHISPEEIATEIYSKSAKGTLTVDMILYSERKNLKAQQYGGSLQDLRTNIDSGYPLIVLVDHGFWIYQQNHFMVVVGYNEKGIIANSGKDRLKFIPLKDFLRSWGKTKFWTLLVTPQ
jgi:ABC-type bacteriocin/lantibiotic exporter with double-glycine peptidase domain